MLSPLHPCFPVELYYYKYDKPLLIDHMNKDFKSKFYEANCQTPKLFSDRSKLDDGNWKRIFDTIRQYQSKTLEKKLDDEIRIKSNTIGATDLEENTMVRLL